MKLALKQKANDSVLVQKISDNINVYRLYKTQNILTQECP